MGFVKPFTTYAINFDKGEFGLSKSAVFISGVKSKLNTRLGDLIVKLQ